MAGTRVSFPPRTSESFASLGAGAPRRICRAQSAAPDTNPAVSQESPIRFAPPASSAPVHTDAHTAGSFLLPVAMRTIPAQTAAFAGSDSIAPPAASEISAHSAPNAAPAAIRAPFARTP